MAFTTPVHMLGLQVSGDLGELTIYTDRFGKKVAFPKSPPKDPPSEKQTAMRLRFRDAQKQWANLEDQVKKDFEDICRQANVPMTGQNLSMHTALMNDDSALVTLMRQTGITVPIPDFIP